MALSRKSVTTLTDSPLIKASLELCTSMLQQCDHFFPFAAYQVDEQYRSIFAEDTLDTRNEYRLIERLQQRLVNIHEHCDELTSVLVYDAMVTDERGDTTHTIVITETLGKSSQTHLFPYSFNKGDLRIGLPYKLLSD
ncbi:hypothetical protein [Aestuariibacter salexigens]|uniref:hypothetical protein n=1 Tax=Aestuariibacter salexigens TaxID=226010 RepID=UPI00041BF644|nr:hypothetical protein [Aestuariibacter salexigens]